MHNPWHAFRRLVGWTLRWAELPGEQVGHTNYAHQTVTLDPRQTQAERRSTIAHETEHVHRGEPPVGEPYASRHEHDIDAVVSRRLVTLEQLADALVWAGDEVELAEELWVDVSMVRARLVSLTDDETRALNQRLDAAELCFPREGVGLVDDPA